MQPFTAVRDAAEEAQPQLRDYPAPYRDINRSWLLARLARGSLRMARLAGHFKPADQNLISDRPEGRQGPPESSHPSDKFKTGVIRGALHTFLGAQHHPPGSAVHTAARNGNPRKGCGQPAPMLYTISSNLFRGRLGTESKAGDMQPYSMI